MITSKFNELYKVSNELSVNSIKFVKFLSYFREIRVLLLYLRRESGSCPLHFLQLFSRS